MRCVIKGLNCSFHFSVQKDVETEMKEEAWTHIVKSKFILGEFIGLDKQIFTA